MGNSLATSTGYISPDFFQPSTASRLSSWKPTQVPQCPSYSLELGPFSNHSHLFWLLGRGPGMKKPTLPETNSEFTPENWWLEDDPFLVGQKACFQERTVSFSDGNYLTYAFTFTSILSCVDILTSSYKLMYDLCAFLCIPSFLW